jgi:hypothetical protein
MSEQHCGDYAGGHVLFLISSVVLSRFLCGPAMWRFYFVSSAVICRVIELSDDFVRRLALRCAAILASARSRVEALALMLREKSERDHRECGNCNEF